MQYLHSHSGNTTGLDKDPHVNFIFLLVHKVRYISSVVLQNTRLADQLGCACSNKKRFVSFPSYNYWNHKIVINDSWLSQTVVDYNCKQAISIVYTNMRDFTLFILKECLNTIFSQ